MFETLLTSSVLILALCVIRLARGKVSARLIYALWLIAALRLMLPFSLAPSPVSVANLYPGQPETALSQPVFELPEGLSDAQDHLPDSAPPVNNTEPGFDASAASPEPERDPDWSFVMRLIWTGGAAAAAALFIYKNFAMYRALRAKRRRIELEYDVLPVYLAENLSSPCLFGVFRPAIYLTPAALETPERTRMVLLHEETHCRHGDHLWALLRCVLLCVYWFDPFVWLAAYLSKRDCELACDESCIKRLGEEKRVEYGGALIDLIDRSRRTDLLATATTMSGGKRAIQERVARIAKAPRSRVAAAALVLALVFAVSACTFTGALRGEAVPGQPLRNATVYFNESDCFWSNKTGHFCAFEAEDSRVLALHWKDNRSNMELRLPSGVRDSDGSVGAFMSDEMAAVCCLDGEGGLRAFVNPDRGGAWNEATLNAGSEGQCFIGFSTVSDGWLAYVRAVDPGNPPDYPGARYTAVFWLTDDSGASWVRVPYEQYFAGKPAGFAITADGEAFAAVNYTEGGGEARVLRSQGPGENWNMVSSIGAVTENSPIPAGSEGGFSARPVYISNDGVVYTYAKQSVEYSGEVSRGSLTEGFWRIPGGKEGAVNSTELADGALRLAQVANEDYDGEYVRSFWARYSVTGRAVGGDIAAWAALTTESGSLSVTAAPVYVRGDGALVCSGEGYGTFTLTPECVLMFPLYDTGQGQPQIGVAAVTGEGERAYIGFGMDGGEIVCRASRRRATPPPESISARRRRTSCSAARAARFSTATRRGRTTSYTPRSAPRKRCMSWRFLLWTAISWICAAARRCTNTARSRPAGRLPSQTCRLVKTRPGAAFRSATRAGITMNTT